MKEALPTTVSVISLAGVGRLKAPPVEFSFDKGSPTWYFLLYRKE